MAAQAEPVAAAAPHSWLHALPACLHPPQAVVKLADNFNGADLRNICTEAGMFAIRDERDYVIQVGQGPPSWGAAQPGGARMSTGCTLVRFCSSPRCRQSASQSCRPVSWVPATWVLRRGVCGCTPDSSSGCAASHPPPQEDFMKAVRKLGEAKKLEGHLAYSADFGDGGKS